MKQLLSVSITIKNVYVWMQCMKLWKCHWHACVKFSSLMHITHLYASGRPFVSNRLNASNAYYIVLIIYSQDSCLELVLRWLNPYSIRGFCKYIY